MKTKEVQKTIRCAIYTRKSTEEGLGQEFNSLDAQREAGEAYIASQRSEGWTCLPDLYDDGGFTGGNMERPALARLLNDIAAGKVDCVLVYKVDRLSRSLMDFSRIMETLDKHGVSFVSVTQAFNTTSSMGRLTLNILLSFAQFEREIISERTRDKIAATRRKGRWTGGPPILGYDSTQSRLIINPEEAEQVRSIFNLYIEHRSLMEMLEIIDTKGITAKRYVTLKGKTNGGNPFTRHSLRHLLTNVLYAGKMTYREEIHPGQHEAIVKESVFDKVQALLAQERIEQRVTRKSSGALLKGLLRCIHCDLMMVPGYSKKPSGNIHRFYVCSTVQKRGSRVCQTPYLKVEVIEPFVMQRVKESFSNHDKLRLWDILTPDERNAALRAIIDKIDYDSRLKQLVINFKETPSAQQGAA